jgi:16S rRNA (cytosine967-C5)-methyltransferase
MLEQNRLNLIINFLELYFKEAAPKEGYLPLNIFLKNIFRKNRQMGSKDRKIVSSACFNFFRLGNLFEGEEISRRIALGWFLCENEFTPFSGHLLSKLSFYKPNDELLPLVDKLKMCEENVPDFNLKNVFPLSEHLSEKIKKTEFFQSFFIRPKTYLRLKKNYEQKVINDLSDNNINFEYPLEVKGALALEQNSKVEELNSKKKAWFEIQDLSSQRTGTFFNASAHERWWDCCAGSGGKSLMLKDIEPGVELLSTDIRPQILENLKDRFKSAGLTNFKTAVIDLTKEEFKTKESFDGIIADVPCSGSGTWGRSPEMLTLFNEEEINTYSEKQRRIVAKAHKHLKPGGKLIYITCSVFKEENEEAVDFFRKELSLQVEKQEYFKGFTHRADTLFAAILKKK